MSEKPDNEKVIGVDFLTKQTRKSKITCPKCKTGNEFSAEVVGVFILEYSEREKKHIFTASANALEFKLNRTNSCRSAEATHIRPCAGTPKPGGSLRQLGV